ncbi:MAG: hypothetical protein ACOX3X_07730 [Eubacteriales bacterium]
MDYKTNNRYFHTRLYPLIVGIVLAILGFINFYYGFLIDSWFTYNLTVVVMVMGVIMVVFFLVSLVRDSQYDETVKTKLKNFADKSTDKVMASDKHAKIIDSYVAENYVLTEPSNELKRGRDGTFRSNYYSAASVMMTAGKVYVNTLLFCLTEEKETEDFVGLTYDAIEDISMVQKDLNLTSGKKEYVVNTFFIEIKTPNGTISIPTHNDSLADGIIEKIKHRREKLTTA